MSTTERDVKQMANALLALQNQYVAMLEEDESGSEGVLSYYRELAQDVAKKTQVSSKYACQMLANQHFHEAFNVETGENSLALLEFFKNLTPSDLSASLYMPMLIIVETSVTFHLALAKTLMNEVRTNFHYSRNSAISFLDLNYFCIFDKPARPALHSNKIVHEKTISLFLSSQPDNLFHPMSTLLSVLFF